MISFTSKNSKSPHNFITVEHNTKCLYREMTADGDERVNKVLPTKFKPKQEIYFIEYSIYTISQVDKLIVLYCLQTND